jgi:hypothetical protein
MCHPSRADDILNNVIWRLPHDHAILWLYLVVISPQNTVIRSVANFFMAMAQQITRGRYRFVDSYQEAVEFLCEQDDSLTFSDEQASPHFEKSE